MRIKFEKTDSVNEIISALSEFLLKENKDYPDLKTSASLYINLVDENGNPHPNNNDVYIHKNGKIVSEFDYLKTIAEQRAKDAWANYARIIHHRHSFYKLVQELKIQEPIVYISSYQENNNIKSVYAYLRFQDSQNNTWWFYNNSLWNTCPQVENKFQLR